MERLMPKFDDLSRSLVALDEHSTLIAVIELSRSSWLIGGIVPGVEREPVKKLAPDPAALLACLHRWRDEAAAAGRRIARICVAYEAGRDGFWLARWLRARGIECHVIHPTSVSVSGEKRHCSMVAVPARAAEDGKRPLRERERLVGDATRLVNIKGLLALHGVAKFNVRARTRRSVWRRCAPRKASRCRPTSWPNCCAGLNGCSRSKDRLRRSTPSSSN
jgi:transposase